MKYNIPVTFIALSAHVVANNEHEEASKAASNVLDKIKKHDMKYAGRDVKSREANVKIDKKKKSSFESSSEDTQMVEYELALELALKALYEAEQDVKIAKADVTMYRLSDVTSPSKKLPKENKKQGNPQDSDSQFYYDAKSW